MQELSQSSPHIIRQGDEICIIRFNCNNQNMANLRLLIDKLLRKNGANEHSYYVNIYRNTLIWETIANPQNASNLFNVIFYNYSNREDWNFTNHLKQQKNYYKQSILNNFVETEQNKRIFILEVSYAETFADGNYKLMCDPINFQYLMLVLEYLKNKGEEYLVLFCGNKTNNKSLYESIDVENYFRFRHTLYFYCTDIEIKKRLFYISSGTNSVKTANRIYSINNNIKGNNITNQNANAGKIFPIVPITRDTYTSLMRKNESYDERKLRKNEIDKLLDLLYIDMRDKIKRYMTNDKERNRIIKEFCEKIESLCDADNYLEKLIFTYTMYYVCIDRLFNDRKINLNWVEFLTQKAHVFHEISNDYSEGLEQLIENALFHSIDGEKGCGSFTIRIRQREDKGIGIANCYLNQEAVYKSPIAEKLCKEVGYFMELYVIDMKFDNSGFQGIVGKFLDNVNKRENDSKKKGNKTHYNLKNSNLMLKDFFETGRNKMLDAFYNNVSNIANHYGLQILDNTIKSNNGYLFVTSGKKDDDIYEDKNYKDSIYLYKGQETNFYYEYGTAYIIYLPIDASERITYADVPIVINNDTKQRNFAIKEVKYCIAQEQMTFFSDNIESGIIEKQKSNIIRQVDHKLKEIIAILNQKESRNIYNEAIIYKIDCTEWVNEITYNNCGWYSNPYEILAKALFIEMTTNNNFNHVALVNVDNRQDVVKLFRQFALFYNKQGQNKHMKNKSVFIVDKGATIDICLQGNISGVARNMFQNQLYGGMDNWAMDIVKHIAFSRKTTIDKDNRRN